MVIYVYVFCLFFCCRKQLFLQQFFLFVRLFSSCGRQSLKVGVFGWVGGRECPQSVLNPGSAVHAHMLMKVHRQLTNIMFLQYVCTVSDVIHIWSVVKRWRFRLCLSVACLCLMCFLSHAKTFWIWSFLASFVMFSDQISQLIEALILSLYTSPEHSSLVLLRRRGRESPLSLVSSKVPESLSVIFVQYLTAHYRAYVFVCNFSHTNVGFQFPWWLITVGRAESGSEVRSELFMSVLLLNRGVNNDTVRVSHMKQRKLFDEQNKEKSTGAAGVSLLMANYTSIIRGGKHKEILKNYFFIVEILMWLVNHINILGFNLNINYMLLHTFASSVHYLWVWVL